MQAASHGARYVQLGNSAASTVELPAALVRSRALHLRASRSSTSPRAAPRGLSRPDRASSPRVDHRRHDPAAALRRGAAPGRQQKREPTASSCSSRSQVRSLLGRRRGSVPRDWSARSARARRRARQPSASRPRRPAASDPGRAGTCRTCPRVPGPRPAGRRSAGSAHRWTVGLCAAAASRSAVGNRSPVRALISRARAAARRGIRYRVTYGGTGAAIPTRVVAGLAEPELQQVSCACRHDDSAEPRTVALEQLRPRTVQDHPRRSGVRQVHRERVDADSQPNAELGTRWSARPGQSAPTRHPVQGRRGRRNAVPSASYRRWSASSGASNEAQ